VAEGVDGGVGEGAGDEVEGQVEVGEGEEGEEEVDELVDELDVQHDFAVDGVVGAPDLAEVDKGINGGEEGTVEPTTPLGYEFGDGIWEVVSLSQLRQFKTDVAYLAHLFLLCNSSHILRPISRLAWPLIPSKEFDPQQDTYSQ
jgi:hypothetical protein